VTRFVIISLYYAYNINYSLLLTLVIITQLSG